MDHSLETRDIAHSWIISSRGLASTVRSVSAASFRSRGFLISLAALPAELSLKAFGVDFLSIMTYQCHSKIPNQVNNCTLNDRPQPSIKTTYSSPNITPYVQEPTSLFHTAQ